jgi:CRISPR/Cas system-associated exonuclease Cas4 (RecB family)
MTTPNKPNILLDATMLDTFLMCPQKFYLRFIRNKVQPITAKPLDRGTLVHTGFEHYFAAIKDGLKFAEATEAMLKGVNVAALESELDPEEISRIKDVLLETCRVNRDIDYQYEILAIEQSFIKTLHEDDTIKINMMGKIDLLVNYKDYQGVPIDHKTYERDFPVHRKTNQFQNYAWATGSNFLFVNRVGFQTSIAPDKKHKRVILSYDPIFLEQWKQNVIKWAEWYLDCEANQSFPLNDTSCDKFNRLCEYYSICDASGQESKEFKLGMNFKDSPVWDVSALLGKKKEV